ncbi:TraX family protein [Methyloversatilis sp. NSM2]|uniref:TraX family protein n=1 Tax=Methyloversatilis sp. NSM2 TaxID=3134135 RepID=UPI003116C6D9
MARTLTARLGDAAERAVEAARATVLPIHPLQIDVLKLIACVCMLIDHINTCLYDRASVWAWLIGRLAFPLFGLTFVLTLKAHKAMATAKRLFIWAICTQPVYALAFANTGFSPWWAGNILFSFAAVAYLVGLSQTPSWANVAKGLAVFVVASIIQAPSSFGVAGLTYLLSLYYAVRATPRVATVLAALAGAAVAFLNPGWVVVAGGWVAVLATLISMSIAARKLTPVRLGIASWLPLIYVAHLIFLCGILALGMSLEPTWPSARNAM